uniref:Uncharacterized protein n=1 Tax=viral metagenome TaxID=1070528 RepID=A0A6M3IYI7_9ZZZZ
MTKERKWGMFPVKGTVGSFLDDGKSIIEELRDEMQEGLDNMSGTNLESTGKYSVYEEAVSLLDDICGNLDGVELPESVQDLLAETTEERRKSLSRSRRMSNGISMLEAMVQVLEERIQELLEKKTLSDTEQEEVSASEEATDAIQSAADAAGSVEFPGFYG